MLINETQKKLSTLREKTGITLYNTILITLSVVNISLTFFVLIYVIKSIRHANWIADRKSYRYTLL